MTSAAGVAHLAGFRYGALGLPLAFVALPLYVYMPAYYAEQFGASLAALGIVLLLVRIFDAVTDPLMGYAADHLLSMSGPRRMLLMGVGCGVLLLGFLGLFFPPPSMRQGVALLAWCFAMLIVTYLAYSALSITHQAWAARLQGGDLSQSRWVSWREAATLAGVVLASVLPSVAGMSVTTTVLGLALALAWLALRGAPQPLIMGSVGLTWHRLAQPWRGAAFRGLLGVFLLNGIASAIPATLLLFFVNDRLQAPGLEGMFLAAYFVCAAASLPLWLKVVARIGLGAGWMSGMLLSVASFAGAAVLGAGDVWPFLLICAASGLALGADLAFPAPLLARVIRLVGASAGLEGAYFGWWNSASKLNLALAAGLVLPLLQGLGYSPGQPSAQGLMALSLAYAVVPCILKLLAWGALWRWRRQWDKEQ
ncbi:MAG: MFS transporter [Pusillimonas sp.]